jgi:hypothetical protein
MSKSQGVETLEILPAGMDQTSGEQPSVLMMLDDGTFKHLIGSNATHLATNIREITPYPVQSATGDIKWLRQMGDLILDHCEFRDCLMNPHNDITLLSEGWLHLAERWEFLNNSSGKLITTPEGYRQLAYRNGVIFYLPSEFVPTGPTQEQFLGEFDQTTALERGYCNSDMYRYGYDVIYGSN